MMIMKDADDHEDANDDENDDDDDKWCAFIHDNGG